MSINLNNNTKVLVLIYADVEAYPPTLNLINLLSEFVRRIDVVERSILNGINIFDQNVITHRPGNKYSIKDQMVGNPILKLYLYLIFLIKIVPFLSINAYTIGPVPLLS